ncbi:MAG: rhomboid family intramembrane serine protease [Gemmatirosa sp.]|nr:rhomboid family intramembrane serine protease [Gemmatirosa sp.]
MTPVVRTLLIATIAAFFVQMTLPALADPFVFVPADVLTHPWTIVTYMFLHGGLTHVGFNMLALYFFGPRAEARLGSQRFTVLYFLSGITGALVSYFLSPNASVIGASAGVYGVMMAFAYFWPDELIYIWGVLPVPARILVVVTTAISLWSGFTGGGGVAHFAHLGGYAGAYLYLKWLDRSRTRFKRAATTPPAEAARRVAGYQAIDRAKIHEVNREEVDRILDKISASGVDSLTPQERLFLSNFVPLDDRMPPKQ